MNGIVLTGATSMLGIALINQCIKNHINILAIVRRNSSNLNRIPLSDHVKVMECNLDELSSLKVQKDQYDVFYHFAWDYTQRKTRDNPILQNKNIQYTLDAVELAARIGCHTFIGAGSQAEYGRVDDALSPMTPVNPDNAYGIAKYTAGKLSKLLCRDIGIRHIWTRILSVYGPYDNENTMIMYTIRTLLSKEKPIYTPSEQQWDYLYSEDAARAFYAIGRKGKNNSIYCIGCGEAHPLHEYISTIRDCIDADLPLGIGEMEYSNNQVMHLCANISNLADDTGFQPEFSFHDGIARTIAWYKGEIL